MSHMVVGFLYRPFGKIWNVALVKKLKPDWQKDNWNGIGGKMEEGETPEEAIKREFYEETQLRVNNWHHMVTLYCPGGTVFFFGAKRTMTLSLPEKNDNGELLDWHDVEGLPDNIITNLKWLVPFCLYENSKHPIFVWEN